ncbi:hypothetical protein SAMN05660477_00400 [Soonwooa buanensis]|uniref:Uncharacterized protein n=1 Tax=Soonwooa buanensis TaxID=619805 RepID=A0A1T5CW20_9FLAO|nr:hypothetical protein [Soonwooa buanensis]SKB63567.1 hypothetical protein SAMN05660477_00400 [Soonwooa buanensis]
MKKILFFLLISNFAFAQLSQDSIQNMAKSYFETKFVQETFKDPYSYELKKIWSEPITRNSDLINKITQLEVILNSPAFSKKEKKQFGETLVKRREELSKLSSKESEIIVAYSVYFDTYGANSLGNKVLGKYTMTVDSNGSILGKIVKLN